MGSFAVNFHIRGTDAETVKSWLVDTQVQRAWMTDGENGWISLVEEDTSSQNDREITRFAKSMSDATQSPVVAFLIHDNDFFRYWLYDNGKLVDWYISDPQFLDEHEVSAEHDRGNHIASLLRYCPVETSRSELEAILHQPAPTGESLDTGKRLLIADEQLAMMGRCLGIVPGHCLKSLYNLRIPDSGADSAWQYVGVGSAPAPRVRLKVFEPDLSEAQKAFNQAILRGDVDAMRQLLASDGERGVGIDVNWLDRVGRSPLHIAVKQLSLEIVALLVDHGAHVALKTPNGQTPLDLAEGMASFFRTALSDPGFADGHEESIQENLATISRIIQQLKAAGGAASTG